MVKHYGLLIKSFNKKDEIRWYDTRGRRMQAMAKIRQRMTDDPNCSDIRFIEEEK